MSVRPTVSVVGLLVWSALTSGCTGDAVEERALRASFEQHRAMFEELLSMFDSDGRSNGLLSVSTAVGAPSRCEDLAGRARCLSEIRESEYRGRMQAAGVLWMTRERDPNRLYFVLYYRPALMDARLRGVVYAKGGSDYVFRLYPHQEWTALSSGWYAYLMIDS